MTMRTTPILASAAFAAMLLPLAGPSQEAIANPAQQQQAVTPADRSAIEVLPANQLINRPLRDQQGRDAGRIDRIVLNTENSAVDFVIVAGRGNLDLNGQVIAVPWSALEPPTADQGPITIKVSADKLAQAPRVDSNVLGNLAEPRVRGDVYGYYGYPYWGYRYRPYAPGWGVAPGYVYAPGAPGYVGPPAAAGPAANAGSPTAQNQMNQTQRQMVENGLVVGADGVISQLRSTATSSADAMRSAPVYAYNGPYNGSAVGNIRQVMIDPQRGEVAFVLIERGGFLGLEPRWYAVPIEALAWAPFQGAYRLTVNEQLLDGEPSVAANNNNAPVQVPTNQLAQLYRHFGMTPYWEQGAAQNGSNAGNAGGSGTNSGSSQAPANLR